MKYRQILSALSLAAFLCMTLALFSCAKSKIPFFSDNFDTPSLLVENYIPTPINAWRFENNHLRTTGTGVSTAKLNKSLPAECEIIVDVYPLSLDGEFAGISVHGVNFFLRPDGYWNTYRLEGADKSLGNLAKTKITSNQKYQFRIVCRKINSALMFSWFINGAKIIEFIEPGKIMGDGLVFLTNKMPASFTNFDISGLVTGNVSSNLLPNSSLETVQDDLPLYWKPADQSSLLPTYGTKENLWNTWKLETNRENVLSGTNSLRLENNSLTQFNGTQTHQVGILAHHPITYSIYIKSDTDDLPAQLTVWEMYGKLHRQDIKVNKEWRRYQMTVTNPEKNSARAGVTFKNKGTIWLDNAQVELGETSSQYSPSILDAQAYTEHVQPIVSPDNSLNNYTFDVPEIKIIESLDPDQLFISGSLNAKTLSWQNLGIQFLMDGQPVTDRTGLEITNNGNTDFQLPFKGAGTTKELNLTGKIDSPQGGLLKQFEKSLRLQNRMDIFTQRNYYMNENNAVLTVQLNIQIRAGMVATTIVFDKDKNILWSNTINDLNPTMHIGIPLTSFPEGAYQVQFEVRESGKAALTESTELIKRQYRENGTQIDRERRCLIVGGKPYLVIAPLLESGNANPVDLGMQERIVKNYSEAGFKTLMHVTGIHPNFKQTMDGIFDSTKKHNMKLIAWPGGFPAKIYEYGIDKIVNDWKNEASLIAWLPVDEPELYAKPEEVIKCIGKFREADPYHPVFMNNTTVGIPSHFANLDTDILSIDDYVTNRENRKVVEIVNEVSKIVKVGERERKPAWMFLVGNNLHNHYREPSVGEQVAQSYGTIIAGATGIYYFFGMPTGKLHWETYKQLNAELLSLSYVIFSLEKVPPAVVNSGSIIMMSRKFNNDIYLISVNLEDKPVEAIITLPDSIGGEDRAELLFENRWVGINDENIADTYAPHQRHVYKIATMAKSGFNP